MNLGINGILEEFSVQFECLFSVAVNFLDIRCFQQGRNIVGRCFLNGMVGGTFDLAAADHIPQRDVVLSQKRGFFFDGFGRFLFVDTGQQFLEAVLGMAVVKFVFTGFDRRKCPENQYFRLLIVYRHKRMTLFFFHDHGLRIYSKFRRLICQIFLETGFSFYYNETKEGE